MAQVQRAMLERLFFLTIQVGSTFAVLLPLGLHWIMNRSWYKEKLPSPAACRDEDLPTLFVVIPTWNEENVIEKKLENFHTLVVSELMYVLETTWLLKAEVKRSTPYAREGSP